MFIITSLVFKYLYIIQYISIVGTTIFVNLHDLFTPPSILLPAWTFPQDTFLNSLQVFPRPCNGTKKPLDSSRPRVFSARFSYLTWKKFKME